MSILGHDDGSAAHVREKHQAGPHPKQEPIERLLLRPHEVAIALGLSRTKVYELLGSGELPHIRIGKSIRVSRTALDQWIAGREGMGNDSATGIEEAVHVHRR